MPSIQITDLSTYNNRTWTKEVLFDPYLKELVLAVDFDLSADIAATPDVRTYVAFEIIDFRTNKVLLYYSLYSFIPMGWQNLYTILGPHSPHWDIGLNWTSGDIFGLRVSVEASHWDGRDKAFNCLAVSDIHWFRLERLGYYPEPVDNPPD
jgi:hypothetical protein